ncbi:hypothetical protein ACTL6U_15570 [Rhodovibrionaceae bacterium A322]
MTAPALAALKTEGRPPSEVMRLARMGSAFQTRLSFMRSLIRRMSRENWRFEKRLFDLDAEGYGRSVLCVHTPQRCYSLVVFTQPLAPEERTDRVIAEAWDATFNLFDGIPEEADLQRLAENSPRQEAGRFRASELCVARANKSLRLFEHIVSSLAEGRQPSVELVTSVGYLMRTTAVYGSGKFGCADRARTSDRPEVMGAFQIEMLAVYLFRWFTLELVDHVARARGGDQAVALDDDLKNHLGIGNSTGLGMAPFLLKHPILIHKWVQAREEALTRVRTLEKLQPGTLTAFKTLLPSALQHIHEWSVEDPEQSQRIERLRQDLTGLCQWADSADWSVPYPWEALFQQARSTCSLEGQELTISLLLEPHGALVDDLAEQLFSDETPQLDPAMTVARLRDLIDRHYDWALSIDFDDPAAQERFWYYSEDKLEPRFGLRASEPGADREMPLAIGRDVARLATALKDSYGDRLVASFLLQHPAHRHVVRRIQTVARYPYAEINDNLIAAGTRPLDLLRFKLAFFGASKFDPKSDLWTRITMYQGAPQPEALASSDPDAWAFPIQPKDRTGQEEGA